MTYHFTATGSDYRSRNYRTKGAAYEAACIHSAEKGTFVYLWRAPFVDGPAECIKVIGRF